MEFWIDGGFSGAEDAAAVAGRGHVPVLGSESLAGAEGLALAIGRLGPARVVLSLDWRGGRFLGPREVLDVPGLWPDRVILMTLDRVGIDRGPDLAALERLVSCAGHRGVFAAGGVRDAADLEALRAIGVAGALVASALHNGRLTRDAVMPFLP
jgi:phosphoribosylformimino-5-aminoimidazole carboxamide ribotide isomerase